MHPSSRAVNSARELGPWTRVVETDLKWRYPFNHCRLSILLLSTIINIINIIMLYCITVLYDFILLSYPAFSRKSE